MGDIHSQDTHVRRSSSMSFALEGKHETFRLIFIIAGFSLAMLILFYVLLQGTATKRISLVIDGKETSITTTQKDLQKLLTEHAVALGEHDRISVPPSSVLKNGDRVVIEHAVPIQLKADGKVQTVYTTEKSVDKVLQQASVALDKDDKITPSIYSDISANDTIQIVRVEKTLETQNQSVPFQTETKNDGTLLKGKQKVVQEGKQGILVKKIEKVYEDGSLVKQTVVDEKIQSKSVNKIVAVGTKVPETNPVTVLSASSENIDRITKGGISFGVKQVLKNVTLTAYSAGAASTGKSAGDASYGITSSGTKVTEGRTIAVDPKLIPIGWWVYIEGVGFRRAEDTGSAVKGKKIDVYYSSDDYARDFGLKRGFTVYVIGPKKPSAE